MDCLPILHIAALHSEPGFRTVTPGIGLRCKVGSDVAVGAGFYRNSNKDGGLSKYAMAAWQPIKLGPVDVGAFGGWVDGYERKGGRFAPMAGLVGTFGKHNLLIAPPSKSGKPSLVHYFITF